MRRRAYPAFLAFGILLLFHGCGQKDGEDPAGSDSQGGEPSSERTALKRYARFWNSLGMEFVAIPAGEFEMGRDGPVEDDACCPKHKVYVSDFYMQAIEVTNDHYCLFLNDMVGEGKYVVAWGVQTNRTPFPRLEDGRFVVRARGIGEPVAGIGWAGAAAFAEWLSRKDGQTYRLPTEAEWEKAARGPEGYDFAWGNKFDPGMEELDERLGVHKVATFRPNGYGLYDMSTNVSEFCSDFFGEDYYRKSPYRNPRGPGEGERHVVRGGNHIYPVADVEAFTNYRRGTSGGARAAWGFRLVMEVPKDNGSPEQEEKQEGE